jgi:hypothetical protein
MIEVIEVKEDGAKGERKKERKKEGRIITDQEKLSMEEER